MPVIVCAVSRPSPLISSLSAPLRTTITFSREPVATSADRKPRESAIMAMKTSTTSPMPNAVNRVETGRCLTLRRL